MDKICYYCIYNSLNLYIMCIDSSIVFKIKDSVQLLRYNIGLRILTKQLVKMYLLHIELVPLKCINEAKPKHQQGIVWPLGSWFVPSWQHIFTCQIIKPADWTCAEFCLVWSTMDHCCKMNYRIHSVKFLHKKLFTPNSVQRF